MPKPRKLHDVFFKRAKEEGYVARSAYKLLEVQERYRVLRSGDRVLDLGCAPGSWLQVAASVSASPRPGGGLDRGGGVVGIDLQPVSGAVAGLPGVVTMVGDIFATSAEELRGAAGGGGGDRYDVVLSDMAPATTGSPKGDHLRSVQVCRRVLELLPSVLAVGGGLVMKVFEGEAYPELLKDAQRLFMEAKGLRPAATREVSREIFIVGKGYKGCSLEDLVRGRGEGGKDAETIRSEEKRGSGDAGRSGGKGRGGGARSRGGAKESGGTPVPPAPGTSSPLKKSEPAYVKKPRPRGWGGSGSAGGGS